jgi:hypothetical protein
MIRMKITALLSLASGTKSAGSFVLGRANALWTLRGIVCTLGAQSPTGLFPPCILRIEA